MDINEYLKKLKEVYVMDTNEYLKKINEPIEEDNNNNESNVVLTLFVFGCWLFFLLSLLIMAGLTWKVLKWSFLSTILF